MWLSRLAINHFLHRNNLSYTSLQRVLQVRVGRPPASGGKRSLHLPDHALGKSRVHDIAAYVTPQGASTIE